MKAICDRCTLQIDCWQPAVEAAVLLIGSFLGHKWVMSFTYVSGTHSQALQV